MPATCPALSFGMGLDQDRTARMLFLSEGQHLKKFGPSRAAKRSITLSLVDDHHITGRRGFDLKVGRGVFAKVPVGKALNRVPGAV